MRGIGDQNIDRVENQIPWLRAALEDLDVVNFEQPLDGTSTADSQEISALFRAAIKPQTENPQSRIFELLSAVMGMIFHPEKQNEPFGAMLILADGRRSAIPSDFQSCVELLSLVAQRSTNVVLRARLSDLCWLLDRKRGKLALNAIAAYTAIVEKTDLGELRHQFSNDDGALHPYSRDYLQRALQIGRSTGWDKPETLAARNLVIELQKKAVRKGDLVQILWFGGLNLRYSVSDPAEIGKILEAALTTQPCSERAHIVVEVWKLAARAYHSAKLTDDKIRCLSEAAERLVIEANSKQQSAILASHLMSSAIAALHGIPGKKDRRTELRHQLVDLQARVPEEMSSFSQELNVQEIVESVREVVSAHAGLLDKLFCFASLAKSPEPEKLTKDAVASIQNYPLSSLFGTSHIDHEGKVIHRSEGTKSGDFPSQSAIQAKVAQAERVRRSLVVNAKIDPARNIIISEHYMHAELIRDLLEFSPFIPEDLTNTFAHGFCFFLRGDFVSATYILTPLLENSLRHVLKSSGYDVTIFDDATQTQEDRTISSLYEQMRSELESVFTPAIVADIERVFLSKPGPYLRHAVAHGLLHDGDPYGADAIYGCWLIFRLSLMPLFGHRKELKSSLTWE